MSSLLSLKLIFIIISTRISLILCQNPIPLPLSNPSPSYYGEFNGASFGYPPIPNLLPQFPAMNLMTVTTEPRRAIPKQADGTDCPMPPECGCLCGRSGKRKKRAISDEMSSEIVCTSGKLRRVVEKAMANSQNSADNGIQLDFGEGIHNKLQNYVLFCQSEKFEKLQFSTDSMNYCHVSRGDVNCLIIQH